MAKYKNNQQSYLAVTSMNYNNYHYGNIFSKKNRGTYTLEIANKWKIRFTVVSLGESLLLVLKLADYPRLLKKIYYCHVPKSE